MYSYSDDDSTSSMNHNDQVVPADPTIPNSSYPSSPPSLLDDAAGFSNAGSSQHPSSSTISGPFPQVKLRIKLGQATPMSAPQIIPQVKLNFGGNDEDETSGEESSFRFSAVNAHAIEDDVSEANSGANNDQSTPKKELRERKKAPEPSPSSSKKGKGGKKKGKKGKNEKKDVKKDDEDEEKEKNGEENGEEDEEEDEVFEVERIVDHMWEDGELKYKVKWVGYGPEWDTFEPLSVLGSATQRIQEYKRSLPVETRNELEAGGSKKSKKGRPTKGSAKAGKRPRRSESPHMPSDEESDDDKDDKDDDFKVDKGGASSSKSRGRPPKSKGALKLFERPKRDAASTSEPRPKRQFLENRQGWLNESDSNASDSEAEREKEKEKKKKVKEEPKEEKKETRVTESPAPKRGKRGATVEETPVPVTNGARHSTARGSSIALVEGMYRHENGEVDVLIAEGRSQRIVPLREAFDLAGFGLVQFLADRFQFQA